MPGDILAKFNTFLSNARHILNVSYRPTNEEFSRSAKVIVLGILLIGFLGFIISLIVQFITGTAI